MLAGKKRRKGPPSYADAAESMAGEPSLVVEIETEPMEGDDIMGDEGEGPSEQEDPQMVVAAIERKLAQLRAMIAGGAMGE